MLELFLLIGIETVRIGLRVSWNQFELVSRFFSTNQTVCIGLAKLFESVQFANQPKNDSDS